MPNRFSRFFRSGRCSLFGDGCALAISGRWRIDILPGCGFAGDGARRSEALDVAAVEVVTDYWFDTLGFALLRVPKAAPNLALRRISEKSGMRFAGSEESDYVGRRFFGEIWEVTAEEWRLRAGR